MNGGYSFVDFSKCPVFDILEGEADITNHLTSEDIKKIFRWEKPCFIHNFRAGNEAMGRVCFSGWVNRTNIDGDNYEITIASLYCGDGLIVSMSLLGDNVSAIIAPITALD